ncbi:CopG family transcriptional regulator [Chloroflexota bacterium]
MKREQEYKTVYLPLELYNQIEGRVKNTEFSSVDGYVIFTLGEIIKEAIEEEDKEVKKRLKALGYLE